MTNIGRFVCLLLAATCVHAGLLHFEGTLDPAANTSLTYWDQYANAFVPPISGPADEDRAYNIAVHPFLVEYPGTVTIASLGYGLGGFDPVVSIFSGTGLAAAYIIHAMSPTGSADFTLDVTLTSGEHTLTVGMFSNEPCALGYCPPVSGTYGDGFTNLVNFDPTRPDPLFYSIDVLTPSSPVPEPASFVLTCAGGALVAIARLAAFRSGKP